MSPLYVGSINMLLANLVQGMISRSMALAAGVNPRTYIGIQIPGGPSRWMWDSSLTPYSSAGYVAKVPLEHVMLLLEVDILTLNMQRLI